MPRLLLALVLGALLVPLARAQPVGPGLDAADLDALFGRPPKVEVNLHGALLRLAASATEGEDEGTSDLIRGLRSVVVRTYAMTDARDGLVGRITDFGDALARAGWSTLVRVRPSGDDTEDVWVYVRENGDAFDGMAVMSLNHSGGDASFVFIDGLIDPSQVGRLGGRFGVSVGSETVEEEVEVEVDEAAIEAEIEAAMEDVDIEQALEEARVEMEDAREERRQEAEDMRVEAEQARAEAREQARASREQALDEGRRARDEARAQRDAARAQRDAARATSRKAATRRPND